jgi:hypothetical protein
MLAQDDEQQAQRFGPKGNLYPHSMAVTVEAIRQIKFELLPHFEYGLDLAPLKALHG